LAKDFSSTDISIIVVAWFLIKTGLVQNVQFNLSGKWSANLSSIVILIDWWAFLVMLFSLYQLRRLMPLIEEIKLLMLVINICFFLIDEDVVVHENILSVQTSRGG